jgi:hypothetical protein
MTKHTPGPWTTLAGDWDGELDGYCRYTIKPLKELNMADSNLIAAAPEMYEALKWVRTLYRPDNASDMVVAIDAAIAKAEGSAQ